MKKLFYSLMTLAAALTVSSCVKDIEGAGYDDASYVDASFAVNLGPQTKAFADGTKVNTLWTGIYETDDATNPTTFKWVADNWTPSPQQPITFTSTGATASFPGKIQLGKTYRVVFFAVYEAASGDDDDPLIGYQWHNTDNVLTGPSIAFADYADALANDDKRDAFYGFYDTGVVSGSIDLTGSPIELKRPYAQVNVLVKNENVPAGTITSTMTVAGAPTAMNLATGATSDPQNWSFASNTIAEAPFGSYANTHKYVAMNYVLVDQAATGASYNVGFTVTAGDATSGPKSIASIPMKPNGRTNIVGNVFAENFDITIPVVVDPQTNPQSDTEVVPTQVTVTVGQTADDAVPLTFSTTNPTWTPITLAINHPVTEDTDMPSFTYDPEGVVTAQFVSYDDGNVQIRVRPLVENGNTKITVTFPAVTKTEYSAKDASFFVKVGDGVNQKILQDVEITTAPTKLTFAVGDKFAFDGAVTATFTNPAGTEVIPVANLVFTDTEVTPNTYVPGETVLNTAGTYNIVVTYTYNGKSLSDMILPGDEPYEITVTDGPALIDRELVFKLDQTAVTEATVTFGADDNIFPTLSGKKIDDVTYSLENVSPAGCVTINESTGAVTLVGAGSATVKATASATTEYQAGVASYALTVNAAPAPTTGSGTQADPYTVAGVIAYIDSEGYNSNAQVYVKGVVSELTSYKFSTGSTASFWLTADGQASDVKFEAYKLNYFSSGTYVAGNPDVAAGDNVVVYGKVMKYTKDNTTTYETSQNAASLYSLNGKTGVVQKPTITGAGGETVIPIDGSLAITLAAESGASIYYTTNGSDPTTNSTLYSAPFSISETCTVKAIAVKDGLFDSAVASKQFTKSNGDATTWVETALTALTSTDEFVIVGNEKAMSNANGTANAPAAVDVTISNGKITSTVEDSIIWTISGNSNDGYTFFPKGSTTTWLYCSTTAASGNNNNIRVGTGARKVFQLQAKSGKNYLVTKDSNVARFVCVYNNADWRGYIEGSIAATDTKFYKKVVTP